MPRLRTELVTIISALLLAAVLAAVAPAAAHASTTQQVIFQDDPHILGDPVGMLSKLRLLGVQRVRLAMRWQGIASSANSHRRPGRFNAANPNAYPARKWAPWDAVVREAQRDGIGIDLDVMGGAPLWATGPGAPNDHKPHPNWAPSAREYGLFVRAVGTRYSGHYKPRGADSPLPRVSFFSLWNEPDYGPSLAPQGVPGHLTIPNAPRMYRSLVDAGWAALRATGHGNDTILFGEVAPRGENKWGVFSGMKPLVFLRYLYCVDSRYRPLRGNAARQVGCPATSGGSRRFRGAHPGLFAASGFADHPYMRWYQPNREQPFDPNYSSLGVIGLLERALDGVQLAYGSHNHLQIYDTEFGYITSPPKHRNQFPWVTVPTAAYYLNWAEYLHWRNPRLSSFEQYLLYDPLPAITSNDYGGFASGLLTYRGAEKATFAAWRLPLYLPRTAVPAGTELNVWGCVRPARFALMDTGQPQSAQIQFQPGAGGPWTTLQTVMVTDENNCYFDVPVSFPTSGTVRLAYTYPVEDPQFPLNPGTVYSRSIQIVVR